MRVCLYLDPSRIFRWHQWLLEALGAVTACYVSCRFSPRTFPLPLSCKLLVEFERLIYGLGGCTATDTVTLDQLVSASDRIEADDHFDIVVDLTVHGLGLPQADRVLTPAFNAMAGEVGLINAVIARVPITVEVRDTARLATPWGVCPVTDHDMIARAVDVALSDAVRLITKAIRQPPSTKPISDERVWLRPSGPPSPAAHAVALHAGATLARKLARWARGLLASAAMVSTLSGTGLGSSVSFAGSVDREADAYAGQVAPENHLGRGDNAVAWTRRGGARSSASATGRRKPSRSGRASSTS